MAKNSPKDSTDNKPNIRERFKALKNLPAFLKEVYQTSPSLTISNIFLRLIRAGMPVLALYIAKLIIDEVIFQVNHSPKDLNHLYLLIGFEFVLAIVGDLLSRGISLTDSLLGDLFGNRTSIQLMKHAA